MAVEDKIKVPQHTMDKLDHAVARLYEARLHLEAAASTIGSLSPGEALLIEHLEDQVEARQAAVKRLREGCEVGHG